MKSFNVIIHDFNGKKFVPYDIMPYLLREYEKLVERNKEGDSYYKVPKTKAEFEDFIRREAMHQWWSRCEYEIILQSWPQGNCEEKWDVYDQILMNIDRVTEIFIENVEAN